MTSYLAFMFLSSIWLSFLNRFIFLFFAFTQIMVVTGRNVCLVLLSLFYVFSHLFRLLLLWLANIFAAPKKDSGFVTVSGDGFTLNIPAKWNPSKEQEFPGTVLRYEDNFDANSNLAVLIIPAEKDSIKAYGSPEQFLESVSVRISFVGNSVYI